MISVLTEYFCLWVVMNLLFDEELNILCEADYASVDKRGYARHDAFCCSKCLKRFFGDGNDLHRSAKNHYSKCDFKLHDGVNVFTKEHMHDKKIRQVIDMLGLVSKTEQKIDSQMTQHKFISEQNMTVFIYVSNNKPLGLLTTEVKKLTFPNGDEKECISASDFAVLRYAQRQGFGKVLFDYMLRYYNKRPDELVYNKPSEKSMQFLNKFYGLEKMLVW